MSRRLLAGLSRLNANQGLLQGRVHQSLWLEMVVAATSASALMALVAGSVVLNHEKSHLTTDSEEVQRDLSTNLTSYEPMHTLQRRLQQASSGDQVDLALVVNGEGRVLAASNNALVGLPIRQALQQPELRPLRELFQPCPTARTLPDCLRQERRLFLGPLPWVGGEQVVAMRQYPLAIEGITSFGDRGTLISVHDAHEAGREALILTLSVFLASLVPLTVGCAGLMLRLRGRLIPELLALAQVDALSGVYNRRAFLETAEVRLQQAEQASLPMSLAVIDVDHFKRINDSHGHDAGDRVIEQVSRVLRASVRGADLVGRLGGDEFVILQQLNGEGSSQALNRILEQVRRIPFDVGAGQPVRVTLSMGVASCETPGSYELTALMADADAAVYVAKDRGRNQMVNLGLEAQQGAEAPLRLGEWTIHEA